MVLESQLTQLSLRKRHVKSLSKRRVTQSLSSAQHSQFARQRFCSESLPTPQLLALRSYLIPNLWPRAQPLVILSHRIKFS